MLSVSKDQNNKWWHIKTGKLIEYFYWGCIPYLVKLVNLDIPPEAR